MYTGSMFGAGPEVFAVWGWVIAHAKKGYVELNPRAVAPALGMSVDAVHRVLEHLQAVDPQSRNKEEDGRRLVREGEFLFRVVSWKKYAEMRDEDARREYQRDWARDKRRQASTGVDTNRQRRPPSTHSDAEADSEADPSPITETKIAAAEDLQAARAPARGEAPPAPAAAAGLDDDIEKVARAIACEPIFAGINALDMAMRTMPVGNRKPVPWYVAAVADAAADAVQGETLQAKQSRLRRYLQSCKAPRVATANAMCLTPEQQAQWEDEKRRLRGANG